MNAIDELYELFLVCFPETRVSEAQARRALADQDNMILDRRDQDKMIGALILRQNTILFFGVLPEYRNKGIGTQLLAEAEELLFELGLRQIRLRGDETFLMPGLLLTKENRHFFEKRRYVLEEGDQYQDLALDLASVSCEEWKMGEARNGITYRLAGPLDREAAVNCAGEAYRRFEEAYWDERLYKPGEDVQVLVAIPADAHLTKGYDPATSVCGTLLIDMRRFSEGVGCIGFSTVKPAWAGQGIAATMVRIADAFLKRKGCGTVFVGYTSEAIVPLYANCGFETVAYYCSGYKILDQEEIERQRAMIKEVYIQYRELEGRMDQIEKRIYDQFCQQGHHMSEIKKLQIYVKPQDFTAYYMINDTFGGKVGIF